MYMDIFAIIVGQFVLFKCRLLISIDQFLLIVSSRFLFSF